MNEVMQNIPRNERIVIGRIGLVFKIGMTGGGQVKDRWW